MHSPVMFTHKCHLQTRRTTHYILCSTTSDNHVPFQRESIEESEYRSGSHRREYPGGFNDAHSSYPPMMMSHPPPVPPLHFTQKGNVNVVPPMTKKSPPGNRNVIIASGITPVRPTTAKQLSDNAHNVQGRPFRHIVASPPIIRSPIETLPYSDEIDAPSHAMQSPDEATARNKIQATPFAGNRVKHSATLIVTEAQVEPVHLTGALGAIPKTSKAGRDANKPPVGPMKLDKTSSGAPNKKVQTHARNSDLIPVPLNISSRTSNTEPQQHYETVIDIDGNDKLVDHALHNPRVENENHNEEVQSDVPPTKRESTVVMTGDTGIQSNEQQDLDDFFHSDIRDDKGTSMNTYSIQPPIVPILNQSKYQEPRQSVETEESEERVNSCQYVHSRTASISSNAAPVMPSVESVSRAAKDPSMAAENAQDADTGAETQNDEEYSDSFFSDSDVEIPRTPANNTEYTANVNTHVIKQDRLKCQGQKKAPAKQTVQRQSAASSKLLKSSYGGKAKDSVNVYKPNVRKKTAESKVKGLLENTSSKQSSDTVPADKEVRLTAMSAAYRGKSPRKGLKKYI